MIRSRLSWLGGLLACGALIAGCGSSSSTTSSQNSSSATTSTPAATTGTASTPTATQSAPSTKSPANVAAAVLACKQEIAAQSTLPAGAKAKLEAVCGEAAKGNTAAVKQAAREVCEEVINKSAVPAGAAKEQALASCKAK